MKRTQIICTAMLALALAAACKGPASSNVDFRGIGEYEKTPVEIVDSVYGYSTFSAGGRIAIVPKEITEKEYRRLLTDKYTIKAEEVDTNSDLFAALDRQTRPNARRYDLLRGLAVEEDEMLAERRGVCVSMVNAFYHYSETGQFECAMWAPLTKESFMLAEDGSIDATFMQSETRTYGKNGIFVGQKGHDCDFHGSLWFYWYDQQRQNMVPLCHYLDFRWSEDCGDFNLCWINDSVLLVKAISTGNTTYGWVGGYNPKDLAPWGTPVYYKLQLTIKQ